MQNQLNVNMSKLRVLLLSLFMCLMLCYPSFASIDGNVFDNADLFTSSEEEILRESCISIENAYDVEVFITTLSHNSSSGSNKAESYLKNFVNSNTTNTDNAIGFVIDMENREYSFYFTGDFFYDAMTNSRQDSIQNHIASNLGDGDYYEAAFVFLEDVDNASMSLGTTATGYESNVTFFEKLVEYLFTILPVILAGLVFGALSALIMTKQKLGLHKEKVVKKEASNYAKNSDLVLTVSQDTFVRKYTTSTRKSSSSSSGGSRGGGSRSSGSRRSGGRSGKF